MRKERRREDVELDDRNQGGLMESSFLEDHIASSIRCLVKTFGLLGACE